MLSEPIVQNVHGEPDSAELDLGVNTCNQNPRAEAERAEAEETDAEVRITIVADEIDGNGRDACADDTRVTLDEPLGDREVIDEAMGESVQVLTPESN
ncbi:MAG: hypothetical protein WA880_12745 [Ornithinimicrobium sp.]